MGLPITGIFVMQWLLHHFRYLWKSLGHTSVCIFTMTCQILLSLYPTWDITTVEHHSNLITKFDSSFVWSMFRRNIFCGLFCHTTYHTPTSIGINHFYHQIKSLTIQSSKIGLEPRIRSNMIVWKQIQSMSRFLYDDFLHQKPEVQFWIENEVRVFRHLKVDTPTFLSAPSSNIGTPQFQLHNEVKDHYAMCVRTSHQTSMYNAKNVVKELAFHNTADTSASRQLRENHSNRYVNKTPTYAEILKNGILAQVNIKEDAYLDSLCNEFNEHDKFVVSYETANTLAQESKEQTCSSISEVNEISCRLVHNPFENG